MPVKTQKARQKRSAEQKAREKKRVERQQRRAMSMRPKYRIELDKNRYPEHRIVAGKIEQLIQRKKFLPAAITGIMIVDELEKGEVDYLLEKYPWIADKILASQPPPPPPDTSQLERMIEDLQQAFLSGGAGSPNGLQMGSRPALPAQTGKTIGGFQSIAMPVIDDEDTMVIRKDTSTTVNGTANFLDAAFGFQSSSQPTPTGSARTLKVPTIAMPVYDD